MRARRVSGFSKGFMDMNRFFLGLGMLAAVLFAAGCDVEPFCITCGDGAVDSGPPPADTGGGDIGVVDSGPEDAGADVGPDGGCLPEELCNGVDDDCDGQADEGIDTNVDPRHCGGCNQPCEPPNAFPSCVDGVCGILECAPGFHDLDPKEPGCEYECLMTQKDDRICDLRDNDCDGSVDEDVDKLTDPSNCGTCGRICSFRNASATCVDGQCTLGQCNDGFYDYDPDAPGCEYECTPTTDPRCAGIPDCELCNDIDDDCDGERDEGNPEGGERCHDTDVGVCEFGVTQCVAGVVQCIGGTTPGDEACNALDDDCDGSVDEDNPDGGFLCGPFLGTCIQGSLTCVSDPVAGTWSLECIGGTGPQPEVCDNQDNDCDGATDEPEDLTDTGALCDSDVGECQQGNEVCMNGALVCMGGVGPEPEICDGLDNDCDGGIDEQSPGVPLTELCGTDTGTCTFGLETCVNGAYDPTTCTGVGPEPEICDGLDNDCNGTRDDSPTDIGGDCEDLPGVCTPGTITCVGGVPVCDHSASVSASPEVCDGLDNDCDGDTDEDDITGAPLTQQCGIDTGTCSFGVESCVSGAFDASTCTAVGPSAEVCDGLDNDCDGTPDETADLIDDGGACDPRPGVCTPGVEVCSGGVLVCDRSSSVNPSPEVCDGLDNDCDGTEDEGFDFANDDLNCGTCGNNCTTMYNNGVGDCQSGACVMVDCQPGYHDILNGDTDGCEYACDVSGGEVCNGLDDDCNGTADDGLVSPSNFCNPNGVCAGTSASCGDVTEPGTTQWECLYAENAAMNGDVYEPEEVSCDGDDNDCDGGIDEPFPSLTSKTGVGCTRGQGVCQTSGQIVCNSANNGVECNAATPSSGSNEACNDADDDCDGMVDEIDDPGTTTVVEGLTLSSIASVVVDKPGGGTMRVMKYEASRPDALIDSPGAATRVACSTSEKLPWTNVTRVEAETACCALNFGGACPGAGQVGWRLCSAPEWQSACEDTGDNCDWSHFPDCTTEPLSKPLATCNGDEYDSDLGTPGDQDALFPTGSATFSNCYTDWNGEGVYDLSGNVKEWTRTGRGTDAQGRPLYEIRGGAYDSILAGRHCEFGFTVAPETFSNDNLGFRCCHY